MPPNEKEYTPKDGAGAITILSVWRGTYVRLLVRARMPSISFQTFINDFVCKNV